MRIFFFFSILHKLYCEVAKELRRQDPGARFSGIVYGLHQLRYLSKNGFPSEQVFAFTEELRRQLPFTEPTTEFFATWEKQHGIFLSMILATDRRYSTFPREQALKIMCVAIEWCEALLERLQPDVIVAEGIDDLLSYVLYCTARQRKIPYLITYASPTPNRLAIYSNPDNHWERVEETFLSLQQRSLTADQKYRAEALISDYRDRQLLPSYMAGGYHRLFSGLELAAFWEVMRWNWVDPGHRLDPSYGGSLPALIKRKLNRIIRAGISSRRYFQAPQQGERYIFYPMQMEPECSTLVFAPFCANQLSVIECLSKSLPIDHILYVKEHPVMLGRRPLSYYRAIRSLPNVRLIAPRVPSLELIRNASAVVVISSTVGWEALLLGKPVIVMGNVWFDACSLVRKVIAVADLPSMLKELIETHEPDREDLLKFVTASLEGTYPGRIEHPDYSPSVLSTENVAAVADAIRQHIEWLGQGSGIAQEIGAKLWFRDMWRNVERNPNQAVLSE